jgi:tetratricopeptide (TPR) repeat protein
MEEHQIIGKRPTFHRAKSRTNSIRIMALLILLVAAYGFMLRTRSGEVKQLFMPTPTATRIANSFILEAEAYFSAGKLDDPNSENDAIDTYRRALESDPNNAEVWAQLARIQAYSSSMLSTKEQQKTRLEEAMDSAEHAVDIDDYFARGHAIKAMVLDWYAAQVSADLRQKTLNDALDEAVRALQLDPNDTLGLAFYAEVQLDQMKWNEAEQYARQAVERDPTLMDTHRVMALVLESLGEYNNAIKEYEEAIKIDPNMAFLYVQVGVNYRHLAQRANSDALYEQALGYFTQAVNINEQLGIKNPLPYVAIAKTYSQMGEFFIAARNGEKALSMNPQDANTYGQLGIIYFKSKNYESALPALQCAVVSCNSSENLVLERLSQENPDWGVEQMAVVGLPLDSQEVAYYYAMYGQTLAYLARPKNDFCQQAYPILAQVKTAFADDTVLVEIVTESENICKRLEAGQ